MIKRNTWRDYFATLRFCFAFFDWRLALRLPIYVTPLVQYQKPKDKHRIIIDNVDKEHVTASMLVGFLDREYAWDRPSFLRIEGELYLHGNGTRYFAPGLSLRITKSARMDIGGGIFSASHNLRMFVTHQITIGDDNMWSYDCVVSDTDAHKIFNNDGEQINHTKEVHFGNHVWLGMRNIVLKGTEIPNGSVIGAGSILRKSYMTNHAPIIAGGKVIKENVVWARELCLKE